MVKFNFRLRRGIGIETLFPVPNPFRLPAPLRGAACTPILFLFFTANLQAREPDPRDADPPGSGHRSSITFCAAPAFTASGTILTTAGDGLTLLARAINSGYLYAPTVTPFVQAIGPYYEVPGFDLSSPQYSISYERRRTEHWSWTVGLQFLQIKAGVDLPASFVDPAPLRLPPNVTYQVTQETHGRIDLATALELEAGVVYSLAPEEFWNPYGRLSVGAGRGYLGTDRSATFWEEHLTAGIGLRIQPQSRTFVFLEIVGTAHTAQAKATNPIDRTRVLVNPGKGNIFLGRASFGLGLWL